MSNQAFRLSGNNDIPAGLHMPSRDALMLPDVLTEGDNLEMPPMPDASFLLSQVGDDSHVGRRRRAGSRDINLQEDFNGSQFLQNSIENQDEDLIMEPLDDLDLGLDLGLDIDDFNPKANQSIEIGRDAPAARAVEDDIFSDMDGTILAKGNPDAGAERDTSFNLGFGDEDGIQIDDEGNVEMLDMGGDQPDVTGLPPAPLIRPERISESPLSDIDDNAIQQLEAEHADRSLFEPEDVTEESIMRNPAQRARRQKFLHPDPETMLPNRQIKDQQQDHDKILRPQSFLPRDPELLALIEMQKNGGFVSSIMGDGRSLGWAPELRGMLSLDAIRKSGELKRKRDSGIADMESGDENPSKSPRLELGEEEDMGAGLDDAGLGRQSLSRAPDGTIIEMGDEDNFNPIGDEDHDASAGLVPESPGQFDDTTAPLLHPADSGPVSLGTKHAVHLLRDRFGPEAANSPDKRKKATLLFQDLVPEKTTSRAEATKMFFEVLVLATKDAVKVEQSESLLGGPIRVRGKRGLWGDWAETGAGGEIAAEEEEVVAGPSHGLERSMAVSVTA
jgi:cohesin complex subunit SCC1